MVLGLVVGGLLLVVFLLGLIVGTASRFDTTTGARTIGYGILPRGAAILGAVIFPACVLAVFFFATEAKAKEQAGVIPYALAGIGAGIGLLLSVETFRRKIVLDSAGVRAFGWFGPPRHWSWDEIANVTRLPSGEYAILARDGDRVKVNPLLMDRIDWFAAACREFLPPDHYPDEFQQGKALQ